MSAWLSSDRLRLVRQASPRLVAYRAMRGEELRRLRGGAVSFCWGGSGQGWLDGGRWISCLCGHRWPERLRSRSGCWRRSPWAPVLGVEAGAIGAAAPVAPGELSRRPLPRSRASCWCRIEVELDRAAFPVLRLDLVLAVLALDLVDLAVALGLQLGEHLLHRDRRGGCSLGGFLAGLPGRLIALGEGALDDAEAESAVARRPPSPTPPVAWSCCSCRSPRRVKSADHLQTATA